MFLILSHYVVVFQKSRREPEREEEARRRGKTERERETDQEVPRTPDLGVVYHRAPIGERRIFGRFLREAQQNGTTLRLEMHRQSENFIENLSGTATRDRDSEEVNAPADHSALRLL